MHKLWKDKWSSSPGTTVGLTSKKRNLTRAAHFFCTFLCRFSARLERETTRNFLVTRFMFFGGTVIRVLVCFFSLPLISHLLPLAFLIFSPPLQNFHVVLPTNNVSFVFSLSRSSSLSPVFSSLSFAGLSPTFSFSQSFSCGNDN